ncbi:hypothetical protein PFICI_08281 [Pestalotiopsis fici W106-1]|uniref:Helicase ATP-binding domain-containing protein n=1 Tax=Pestalotiopsis fici (strain W106-1 / CGMCC3.15140) TaxID=1229662 RepID=W3X5V8_PESFW|nr:uncharacterized protein PFICI_08281 [Pestalotiopsis fici W106-1]ETS80752.1 hypothetical protein PFICI_08281 [Pestalotiopsis fici W106-1]
MCGEEVGYAISLEGKESERTRLRFCTDGLLLSEAHRNQTFAGYSCIIIDEVHERSLQTDILLLLLKTAIKKRNDLRVILMSATVEAAKFQEYFGGDTPILSISGRQHHVEEYFLPSPAEGKTPATSTSEGETPVLEEEEATPDVVETAVCTALHIHNHMGPGDILIFLSGEQEIYRARAMLMAEATSLEVIPLHASLSKTAHFSSSKVHCQHKRGRDKFDYRKHCLHH